MEINVVVEVAYFAKFSFLIENSPSERLLMCFFYFVCYALIVGEVKITKTLFTCTNKLYTIV